ncbi:MAG: putative transposase, partial [Gammaproteobacteria bacterium]
EQLAADPWRHRFTRVFDREGYSPGFFLRMKQKHIACLTYHKYRLLYELVSSQNP